MCLSTAQNPKEPFYNDIMFVEFFCEKYVSAMDKYIPA